MKQLIRDTSTPEKQLFWDAIDKSVREVEGWPDWKKGWVRRSSGSPDSGAQSSATVAREAEPDSTASHAIFEVNEDDPVLMLGGSLAEPKT
jgi:hypothetical protein